MPRYTASESEDAATQALMVRYVRPAQLTNGLQRLEEARLLWLPRAQVANAEARRPPRRSRRAAAPGLDQL